MEWQSVGKDERPQMDGVVITYDCIDNRIKTVTLSSPSGRIMISRGNYDDYLTVSVPKKPEVVKKHFLVFEDFGRVEKQFDSATAAIKAMQGRTDIEIEEREVIVDANES